MSECHLLTRRKLRFLSLSPPLDKNIIKDDSILQGANHKVRIDARNNSSISSPQVKQIVMQNDRVNSRHGSGIDSPRICQSISSNGLKAPNMGDQSNGL